MSKAVLDSSAVLACFFGERGADVVQAEGSEGVLSAVSYSETLAALCARGVPLKDSGRFLAALGLTLVPFDHAQAAEAAALFPKTAALGLPFPARACLACARLLGVPALTADRTWKGLKVGVEVVLV